MLHLVPSILHTVRAVMDVADLESSKQNAALETKCDMNTVKMKPDREDH